MAALKSTKTLMESREYTVRLTPKGEAFVAEQRTAAKLAVAAAKLETAERLAGDWREEWVRYANCCGNDADRGW